MEPWETQLWAKIEKFVRENGGAVSFAGEFGGLLSQTAYPQKVKSKYGKFTKFLEGFDPARFKVEGQGAKRKLSLLINDSNKGREDGVVKEITKQKIMILADSQKDGWRSTDLFFATLSHVQDREQRRSICVGCRVSFKRADLPPNPNPYATDIVLLSPLRGKALPMPSFPYRYICTLSEASEVCEMLQHEQLITMDCEGVNLGRPGGTIRMVQVAAPKRYVAFLFDLLKCPALKDHLAFVCLLQDVNVVKVLHDCRMDVCAIQEYLGARVSPVLDTQVAFSLLKPQQYRKKNVGLADMIRQVVGKNHDLKHLAPHHFDPSAWGTHDLSHDALSYAASDVLLLMEVVQSSLFQRLEQDQIRHAMLLSQRRAEEALSQQQTEQQEEPGGDVVRLFATVGRDLNTTSLTHLEIVVEVEFDQVLHCLPDRVQDRLMAIIPTARDHLVDVQMDLFRPVCFASRGVPGSRRHIRVHDCVVTQKDLDYVLGHCSPITDSKRACLGSSLHRCSVIRDADTETEDITGLTIRVARNVRGIAGAFSDMLSLGKSLLLVGPPGLGKTTLLRDVASTLSCEHYDRNVMVVDTSNEIAGEGTLPHAAIGDARRMKVGPRTEQYRRMLEAVQNHTPDTLIIDEIGTKQEVFEAIGVKQRGVQLIATTHGRTLEDVVKNPDIRDLVGGVNTVILSSAEREAEQVASKTRIERRMDPAFDVCIEILDVNKWRVHVDLKSAVDVVLNDNGSPVQCEIRELDPDTGCVSRGAALFP